MTTTAETETICYFCDKSTTKSSSICDKCEEQRKTDGLCCFCLEENKDIYKVPFFSHKLCLLCYINNYIIVQNIDTNAVYKPIYSEEEDIGLETAWKVFQKTRRNIWKCDVAEFD